MSQKLWRKNLINITPYVAGEQPKNREIVKLNANENPYPPSPRVSEVLKAFNAEGLRKYPSADAVPLKQALAKRTGLKEENIFCGNGSDDVLAAAFRAFFNSDKPIVYPDITYSFYPVWCDLLKIPYRTIPVDSNFKIDPDDYNCENGGVVIANPNAPTAIGEGREFIEKILQANPDVIVIIDEAYVDFGEYSAVELIGKYDNLVVTQTFSKSRSLAGMRVGMAFADAELISYMQAVKDSYNSYPLDSLAIQTAVASAEDEEYFKDTLRKVVATREKTKDELEKLGFEVTDSQTNFLFAKPNRSSAKEIFGYLKTKDIYIRYFNKPVINEWLRITIGTDEQMKLMIDEIKKFLENN